MKYLLFTLLAIGALLSCTPQTAGTVDDVGVISGQLVTGDGKPVDYPVTVFLYRSASATAGAFRAGLSKLGPNAETPYRKTETITGIYTFDSIPDGEYRINVAEDDIVVAKQENIAFVTAAPTNDTITVEEVVSLAFIIDSDSLSEVIVGESIIDNCKVLPSENGYMVKTVAAQEFTFKMVAQQNGSIDTVSVHAAIDSSKSARFEVVDSPVDFTIIPIDEGTGIAVITTDIRRLGIVAGAVSFFNPPEKPYVGYINDSSLINTASERLIRTFSAAGEDTLRDTILFTGINGYINIHIANRLAAPKTWLLHTALYDRDGLPADQATDTFTTIPAERVTASTVLFVNHSALRFVVVGVPASFSRMRLYVDGEIKGESIFTTAASRDSAVFTAGYLTGDSSGIPHVLALQATGRYRGTDRTFTALDTTITAFSRSNSVFSAKLAMPQAVIYSGMKLISAGTFTMGPDSTNYASEPGVITREVTLTRDFWMDSAEVTQHDFAEIMAATYSSHLVPNWDSLGWGAGDNYPAHSVNWIDAALYCNALTKASGSVDTVYRYESMSPDSLSSDRMVLNGLVINLNEGGFHLPTEAQWEYACRGGTTTDYYFGSASADEYAWHVGNSEHTAHPVAQKLSNAFGLYDMIGNLREWCNDWEWDYDPASLIDPAGPDSTPPHTRIQRGDDWDNPPAKSNTRLYYPHLSRIPTAGFRVCKTVR
jgi:formylglycine-generating enzyme required for sulfatase activity